MAKATLTGTFVTPVRTTVIVATLTFSFVTNRAVLKASATSLFTIVSTALLKLSDAELAGELTALVNPRLTVRSTFTIASSSTVSTRLLLAWPGANASTLVTPT